MRHCLWYMFMTLFLSRISCLDGFFVMDFTVFDMLQQTGAFGIHTRQMGHYGVAMA